MHECPNCGQACDCDDEDLWHEFDEPEVEECCHECEEFDDEEDYDDE